MKKLILIVALFVSQIFYGQYYTFQVFTNYEEIFVGGNQIAEPFQSFLTEHGIFYPDIVGPGIIFEDDPGDYIFPMYVVHEQANALEDLLINSDIISKYVRHNGETPYVLDRLYFRYHVDFVPEFLGIQNGIAQTDYEPLNILFENFQVDNYVQSFPTATWPINLAVHQIRCNGCDIFQLAQEINDIEIVELAELVEYEYVLNLDEIEDLNTFTLYPNPNNGSFEILLNNNDFIGTSLVIFDALGRKVYEEKLINSQTTMRLNIISPGLYFAQLKFNERISAKKFVVK
jgi:hypothetical protein